MQQSATFWSRNLKSWRWVLEITFGPRDCHIEWSKLETEKKILYIKHIYIETENLEKCYRWTYLQGRNRGIDVENGYMWTQRAAATAAGDAKSLHSCPTLCDPRDGNPPGSQVPGFLQARTTRWVPISFSSAWKWKVKVKSLSRVRLFATPWTAAHQARPSMGSSRPECWSGVPLPSPQRAEGEDLGDRDSCICTALCKTGS